MVRSAINEAMTPPSSPYLGASEPSGSSGAAPLLEPRLTTETHQDTTACDLVAHPALVVVRQDQARTAAGARGHVLKGAEQQQIARPSSPWRRRGHRRPRCRRTADVVLAERCATFVRRGWTAKLQVSPGM
jgi:hypothetical protein